ncbi:hypothetical protein JTB14_012372 [Gonioctena quinquepunctata]|nr:hypothetical protein JTB14_012372 [Gonioctena quinquepunctata]
MDEDIGKSLYVDDLTIYYSGRDMQEVEEKIQTTINQLTETATSIGFRFSPTKTHCIDFCRLRTRHNAPELYMNGIRLEEKSTMKILGATFDKNYTGTSIEDLPTDVRELSIS